MKVVIYLQDLVAAHNKKRPASTDKTLYSWIELLNSQKKKSSLM